ncbi:MAG TPA: YggT family protein [Pelomicrobium sp.]|nr:YggT family protein [Pelomicrobium sp.]
MQTLFGLLALAFLLRFYLQLFRAPPRNPLSHFLAALTNWAVLPARRVVPGLWGADLSSLVLAWLTTLVEQLVVLGLRGYALGAAVGVSIIALALLAAVQVLKISIYILIVAVIAQAILSWVNPHTPVAPILHALTRPFLRPFQRRVPLVGGVDLSPLFVLILCQLALMLPVAWLEASVLRLL